MVVEGNHYFPPQALKTRFFEDNDRHTVCPWKGTANYKDVVVDGKRNEGGAWYYPTPTPAADKIRGYFGFWRGVKLEL